MSKLRLNIAIAVCSLSACAMLVGPVMLKHARAGAPPEGTKIAKGSPVVVELFTSEGCSSCPPADALLARISKSSSFAGAPIIAIAEHVDYFNHLGWADPYSKSQFTERQQGYVDAMHLKEVYTPQMIVDGRIEFLGHNEDAARTAIAAASRASKATVNVHVESLKGNALTLKLDVGAVPAKDGGEAADILVGVTEDNLNSSITRGENAGRKLAHVRVLRGIKSVGTAGKAPVSQSASATLQEAWKRADLWAIVLVQGHDTGHIYGAGQVSIQKR
jgi:hypothetical protein